MARTRVEFIEEVLEEFTTPDPPVYIAMEQVGAGGFGQVYKATKEDGSEVAVKLIGIPEEVSPEEHHRIVNEIALLESVDHKNIVQYHQCFIIGDAVAIEMELMNHTLLEVIHTINQTESEIAYFIRSILEGLAYLHQNGIVFRDLHTGNVMLNSMGEVKLVDFGLAEEYMPPMAAFPGDRMYWAPELFHSHDYNHKIDIWALGIILFQMIFKDFPVYIDPTDEDEVAHPVGQYGSPAFSTQGISTELVDFLGKCLTINPTERASSIELLQHPFLYFAPPSAQ